MLNLSSLFFLLIIFQLKHFTGNFYLRHLHLSDYFYTTEDDNVSPSVTVIFVHSIVHAIITLGIVLIVRPSVWYIAIIDLVGHFFLDYIKLSKKILGRWSIHHPLFWWSLDLVKMGHTFVYYYFVYVLLAPNSN
jgi:hypothetical protein